MTSARGILPAPASRPRVVETVAGRARRRRDDGVWDYVKLVLASPYTLFSAVIAATLGNMAAFGTDQDMVQRMLTAETYKKAAAA